MQSENTKRIIRNIAVIGGIILVVIIVFLIIRGLFFAAKPTESQLTDTLLNTSTDRGVQMIVRGPIVASENARTYEIDVTPTSRAVTLFSGYDGTVMSKQVYDNSTSAYEQFVYALDKANMNQSRKITDTDTRGVCATGRLYTFAILRDTTVDSSLWTSSCRDDKGTLSAPALPLKSLFDAQIPDISKYRGGLY